MEIQGARVWTLEMAGADTLYKLDETKNLCEQMRENELGRINRGQILHD